MDPSVLNEQSTKCECEFSIRYGDIFSGSVPTVNHAVLDICDIGGGSKLAPVKGGSKPAV